MQETWLRTLAWTDYRLAVILTVLVPIILTVWALLKRESVLLQLLIIYWRVSSLLMITVYLLIPGWRIGFISGWLSRFLIVIALWFWVDINEDITEQPDSSLKLTFTAWRWANTIYNIAGGVIFTPFLSCAINSNLTPTPFCQIWTEAPWLYREILHRAYKPEFLGFWGAMGLGIYALYLAHFLIVRLGKQGRSALEP